MAGAEATTIGLLRVVARTQPGNALVTRLAVEALLAGADLRPPGLPPAAVLIVARLPAHRPFALRPGMRPDPAWERAARQTTAGMVGPAARPWASPAPLDCPAVLFSDEAELLACLVLDISLGRAAERWWWRAFLRRWGRLTPDVVAALLAESPRATPAALRMLAERDKTHQVLHRMTPSEALQVLRAVCEAFDAPYLAHVAATMGRQSQLPAPTVASAQSGESERAAPPWQPFTARQARPGGLAPHNACLLGVSLALAQAPAAARSVGFAQAVERWWREEAALPPDHDRLAPREMARATSLPFGAPVAVAGMPPVVSTSNTPPAMPSSLTVAPGSESPAFPKVGDSDPGTAPVPPQTAHDRPPAAGRDSTQTETAVRHQHAPAASVAPAGIDASPDSVVTELGGVLFLLNVMQRLDLPDCFEPEWRLASQVGPGGVLELLGRALLDAARLPTSRKVGNLAADPLWAALARLAGRQPGQPAGAGFDGPDHVDIPAFWTPWLGDESVAGQRVDLASVEPLDGPLLDGAIFGMRRWLAVVTPLLCSMLARTLGVEGDGDPAAVLLLRRGQLYVTSSHVDLVMPLDGASLPVRLAGLDFDPGWLPAYGRVVQFHYEGQGKR